MFRSILISGLLLSTSLLTACGAGPVEEDDPVSVGSSSTVTISSLDASSANSSQSNSVSRQSSTQSNSSSSANLLKQVTIQWSHPIERENGEYLELDEIGGYEIRVFNPVTSNYLYHQIAGNSTTNFLLNDFIPDMTIEIAVYDTEGLYSQFVPVTN